MHDARHISRALALSLVASILAACSHAEGSSFTPSLPTGAGSAPARAVQFAGTGTARSYAAAAWQKQSNGPLAAVDLGHRAKRSVTKAVIVLNYNHAAELKELVAHLRQRRTYMSPREFAARFDPTPGQEHRVVTALERGGFTITHRYENHLVIDATAPAATVERYFSTRIDDFRQGRYGVRFAAVNPVQIPAAIAPLVSAAVIDNVVHSRVYDSIATGRPKDGRIGARPATASPNVVRNPGFESGTLAPWQRCGAAKLGGSVAVTKSHPQSGKYDAYVGAAHGVEPNGRIAVCQLVTVPAQATLSVWSKGHSTDPTAAATQFGSVQSTRGKVLLALWSFHGKHNDAAWVEHTADLSQLAGQQVYLEFGVIGKRAHRGKTVGQYIDDVSLTGVQPTPTPTATPSPVPTATPTPVPTAYPTTTPVPTSVPSLGPDNGWGPAPVASGFHFPSTDGYTGAGQTVAIVIDAAVSPTDVSTYLGHYGIVQTGNVQVETVDGGDAYSSDQLEADLDAETIASLAPGANIIVYDTPDLSNQSIIDAYNQIVSDAKASVVNSSFGQCEQNDPSYDGTIDQIAGAAALTGTTFVAASGDTGPDCFEFGDFGPSVPASSPHFVAVGGTEAVSPAYAEFLGQAGCSGPVTPVTNPVVWNDCKGQGGAGISSLFTPAPSYQSGIAGASSQGRNVPDISLPATYDDIYDSSYGAFTNGWGIVGGTSWASPIYVAMQAEINQVCGRPIWGINAIYNAFSTGGYRDFIDVTSGNDYNAYAQGAYYTATSGFDTASGIGMPLGLGIAADNGCVPQGNLRHRR